MAIVEQESHRWSFFILSLVVGGTMVWTLYDEVVTRRPWKYYQDEFARLAEAAAMEELEAAKAKVDAAKLQALRDEMAKLETELAAPDRAAGYVAAKDGLRKAIDALGAEEMNLAFRKGESDELFYYYTLAITKPGHAPTPNPPARALGASCAADADCDPPGGCLKPELGGYCALPEERPLREKNAEIKAIQAKVAELEAAKAAAIAEVAKFDGRIAEIKKEIEGYETPIADAERKLEKSRTSASEIMQLNLTHLGRVDRCVTCHSGIDRVGFENEEKYANPYRTHPKRDVLLAKHPVESFGCTVCHDGEGPQTKGIGALGAKFDHGYDDHYWETPLLDVYPAKLLEHSPLAATPFAGSKKFVEAACLKCHATEIGIWAEMSCSTDADCPGTYTCTEVKPVVLLGDAEPPAPAPGTFAKKSCERKDIEGFRKVDYAPTLTRGAEIVAEIGCFGCHPIPKFLDRGKIGPNLNRLKDKTSAGWLVEWIKYPKTFRPNTKMPNFFPEVFHPETIPLIEKSANPTATLARYTATRDEESKAMAAFLWSISLAEAGPIPGAIPVDGDATRGEKLFFTRGCEGCHAIGVKDSKVSTLKNRSSHFSHAPDLANVGAKLSPEWAFAWIKDPKLVWPGTRMPSLRLPDQEVADLVAFLMTKKGDKPVEYAMPAGMDDKDLIAKGGALVRKYGCAGCHDIPTMEAEGKVGADLAEFGTKDPHLLDFGNAIEDHHQQNWYTWLNLKITHPRAYGTERIETRMPEFELTPEEIEAVMVFLKGNRGKENLGGLASVRTPGEKAVDEGRRVMLDRNCFACHNIDQWAGALMAKFPGAEAPKGPPSLWREGEKAQGPFLFSFVKSPIELRPWLEVVMPTFGFSDTEATALAGYFAGMEGVRFPYEAQHHDPLGGDRLADAKALFEHKKCAQCHPAAGGAVAVAGAAAVPASDLAPDLTLAKTRLRSEFITLWLHDPSVFAAPVSTKMPTLFYLVDPDMDDAPVLKGKYKEQIELLRDYLFIYGTEAAGAGVGAAMAPAAAAPDAVPGG